MVVEDTKVVATEDEAETPPTELVTDGEVAKVDWSEAEEVEDESYDWYFDDVLDVTDALSTRVDGPPQDTVWPLITAVVHTPLPVEVAEEVEAAVVKSPPAIEVEGLETVYVSSLKPDLADMTDNEIVE